MKKLIILTAFMAMSIGAFAQSATNNVVGKLNVYTAKVAMKRPYREKYFEGSMTFKKGGYIADSQDRDHSIKSYNKVNYLYNINEQGEESSCYIPKANVTIKTYEMGELPVSVIGDGIYFDGKDYEGNTVTYHMFIATANGHKFYNVDFENDYAYVYDQETTAMYQRFCVIASDRNQEYILPIEGDHVKLYEDGECLLHEDMWANYKEDEVDWDNYTPKPSFNARGQLISDMYMLTGEPDWLSSWCYIPSLSAMYVGEGVVAPIRNSK